MRGDKIPPEQECLCRRKGFPECRRLLKRNGWTMVGRLDLRVRGARRVSPFIHLLQTCDVLGASAARIAAVTQCIFRHVTIPYFNGLPAA